MVVGISSSPCVDDLSLPFRLAPPMFFLSSGELMLGLLDGRFVSLLATEHPGQPTRRFGRRPYGGRLRDGQRAKIERRDVNAAAKGSQVHPRVTGQRRSQ